MVNAPDDFLKSQGISEAMPTRAARAAAAAPTLHLSLIMNGL